MTPARVRAGARRNGHPIPDEFLLDYAAGTAPEPIAVLVAAHAALNPASRAALRQLEAAGGALLAGLVPAPVNDDALDRALARLGPQDSAAAQAPARPAGADAELPAPLRPYAPRGLAGLRWRGLRGFSFAALPCREPGPYRMYFLRVGAGRTFPHHGHTGMELLLVLEGGFSDEHGHYGRGDVCLSDEGIEHRPIADPDGACLCLAVTQGTVRFTGLLGRLFGLFARQ